MSFWGRRRAGASRSASTACDWQEQWYKTAGHLCGVIVDDDEDGTVLG